MDGRNVASAEESKLEKTVNEDKRSKAMRLGKIALTTLGYGAVGLILDEANNLLFSADLIAPLTAVAGLGISVYNEVRQKGINLVYPALGILVGGLTGDILNAHGNLFPPEYRYDPRILAYGGAALGGALGLYKSLMSRRELRR